MALPEVPISRNEQYLNNIATGSGDVPEYPVSRIEQYLAYIAEHGGGGGGGGSWESITGKPFSAVGDGLTTANDTLKLSGEPYTAAEKSKLSGVAIEATKTQDNHLITNGTILINENQVIVYDDADVRQALAGFNKGYVISGESVITGTKNPTTGDWSNITAITGITLSDLKVGDNVYLIDNTAPDFWVSQITPTVSLNVLDTKTDLSNYYNKGQVDNLLDTKENTGKITIGGTEYTVAISTTDAGQAGYITFVVES